MEDIIVLLARWVFNFDNFFVGYALVTFEEKPQMKINRFIKLKHGYLIHTWSDKAFKGAVVNWVLPSFYGGSPEITLTVPSNWL